jgi:hypothetical protein
MRRIKCWVSFVECQADKAVQAHERHGVIWQAACLPVNHFVSKLLFELFDDSILLAFCEVLI